eukprot:CAMPEP_0116946834 /NCGR_PEP_ID=MMETSP0467-20121206/37256_1 /TAXON_ID=283647 /ORGANISM="Mesodinium pulex, Strain SPMC105" /LENGTH=163 /DNA_ID=CAMNT_0004630757 /DNA_START=187 /DNA_END=678 /DNA_ORIENTATION=+
MRSYQGHDFVTLDDRARVEVPVLVVVLDVVALVAGVEGDPAELGREALLVPTRHLFALDFAFPKLAEAAVDHHPLEELLDFELDGAFLVEGFGLLPPAGAVYEPEYELDPEVDFGCVCGALLESELHHVVREGVDQIDLAAAVVVGVGEFDHAHDALVAEQFA